MGITDFHKQWCISVMEKMEKLEITHPFRQEFGAEFFQNERDDIKNIVRTPMNLQIVRSNLRNNRYNSVTEWERDVNLIWTNALTIFKKESTLHTIAEYMLKWFKKRYAKFPANEEAAWLMKFQKTQAKAKELIETYPGKNQ